ncbi:MAG: hypothetical protein LC658_12865, partial [Bacteroidales bacterium]|nr:hypothetical protein [Bacteroidales bacterium]
MSSPVAENTTDNLLQNPVNQNQKNKIEKQGAYVIGYINEKNSKLFDRRYAIFENKLQKNGTVKPVKVAFVKSFKSPYFQSVQHENRYRTAFYQISGKRINVQNAYLEKVRGTGINL